MRMAGVTEESQKREELENSKSVAQSNVDRAEFDKASTAYAKALFAFYKKQN